MENMFEKASRRKLRFDTPKGLLTVEDLWDIPLTSKAGNVNLDDTARGLNKLLKDSEDVSFVVKEQKSDETVQLAFDIVKYIIDVRLAENDAAAKAKADREKKQHYLAIIAQKELEKDMSMPLDELKKMVEEM
jgi:hypothetical protein